MIAMIGWVKLRLKHWILALILCGWLTWVLPALADGSISEPTFSSRPVVPTELDATNIPSEKVEQFVSAYLSVAELVDERGEDLQRAETETESLRLQHAIEDEAFDLIRTAGLTQQDYFQLLGLANTDPEFRDRVLAQLDEQDN